jgi:hypothetical protein
MKATTLSFEHSLYFSGLNPRTCTRLRFQQAIIMLCIRRQKYKILQLQFIFTQGWDLSQSAANTEPEVRSGQVMR